MKSNKKTAGCSYGSAQIIANKVSKGTGFTLASIVKKIEGERVEQANNTGKVRK